MSENRFEINEKGDLIPLNEIQQRLEEIRLQDLKPAPWATITDFIKLQGGIPYVFEDKDRGLTTIIHAYIEKEPRVTSHRTIENYGVVKISQGITGSRKPKSFPTAMVFSTHGGPCEKESLKRGGEGYTLK